SLTCAAFRSIAAKSAYVLASPRSPATGKGFRRKRRQRGGQSCMPWSRQACREWVFLPIARPIQTGQIERVQSPVIWGMPDPPRFAGGNIGQVRKREQNQLRTLAATAAADANREIERS